MSLSMNMDLLGRMSMGESMSSMGMSKEPMSSINMPKEIGSMGQMAGNISMDNSMTRFYPSLECG